MKQIITLFLLSLILIGCTPAATSTPEPPTQPPTPFEVVATPIPTLDTDNPIEGGGDMPELPIAPLPSDSNLQRGNVFIESIDLLTMESFPLQFSLAITGSLPTPCHQFRADVAQPDTDNKISIEVYSLVDPNMMCVQVLKEFSQNIPLGSFPSGHYEVWLNGAKVAEFDA